MLKLKIQWRFLWIAATAIRAVVVAWRPENATDFFLRRSDPASL